MQKAWQAWTFVAFGQKSSVQDGRAEGACVGFGAIRAQFGREVFCPRRSLEAGRPWQARIFAAAELAPSMTLKSYWVPKP